MPHPSEMMFLWITGCKSSLWQLPPFPTQRFPTATVPAYAVAMRDTDKTELEFVMLTFLSIPAAVYYLMRALMGVLGG